MTAYSRPRAWQRMLSGRRLDLLDPRPEDIAIEDIAHGLARVARWNGQTAGPHIFSVAQHSLLVEDLFASAGSPSPQARLAALLHDAPEYVVGDLISPFKAVLGDDYKAVELRILAAVFAHFGVRPADEATQAAIKAADRAAARLESTDLAGFAPNEADLFFGPRPPEATRFARHLAPQPADEAATAFHQRIATLLAEIESTR